MKFALQINTSPGQSDAGFRAYQFIVAALAQQHDIVRVFFYHDGIYHAFKHAYPVNGETALVELWSHLAKLHELDLVVCISAAQRRGLLHGDEAERRGKVDNELADGFRISGLSQLVEAMLMADRFMVFA
ncbi:sulfurtransferase complex subunit TusD [Methylocucumis oryzae]|uniref:Sulfurtransferase n=1 Tax=Methylocucumis oryzae TaxID=1632867 RepID=A0A0F3IGX0_9GAMM|nr:sulfurtransferase complex subunit TusD [Methylocucumis oryzae]KJV05947.1 sulfurtransferase [Methylocucumis oryzae]